MPENRKSVVVDIVSDSKKFLNGFEEAIKEIEKSAKKANILGNMQDDIDELKQSIVGISKSISNIKPTVDDSSIQKMQEKMESLDNSIKYLKKNVKEIKFDANESSGANLEKQMNSIKNEVSGLISQMREASSFITELFNIKGGITSNSINNATSDLESYKKKLNELKSIQENLKAKDTTIYSKMKFKEAEEELDRYKDKYIELEQEISRLNSKIKSGNLQDNEKIIATKKLNSYKLELASVSREIIDIQDRLEESKGFKGEFFDVATLQSNIKAVEKILSSNITSITNRIAALSKETNSVISANTFELKDGKINIPVELDKTATKLKSVLQDVLNELQATVNPVTVPIQLVSAYKTNTKKEVAELKEIKALQSGIDQLSDDNQKSIAQSTLDKIKSQFQKELRIDIKTNISETEKDINNGINAIKKILRDEKIVIYPDVELTKENKDKLQKDILNISKNFKIDFPVSDFEQSIKTLTDESLIKNWGSIFTSVIDEVCSRIEKATGQLQTGAIETLKVTSAKETESISNVDIKELKEMLKVLHDISNTLSSLNSNNITLNLDSEALKRTNYILIETYKLINKIFDVSGLNSLTKQFDNLREKFQSIAKADGSFDARKKELKELISEYQKYLDMGGKNPITNLTENEKSQKKLLELLDKQIQAQNELQQTSSKKNTTNLEIDQEVKEISNLTDIVDDVIKKINDKTEAFKQEQKVVSSIIPDETEQIGKLVSALTNVKRILEDISVSTKSFDLSNLSNLGQLNKLKPDKINSISTSINSLAEGINGLNLKDGNILGSLQDILNKANELKDLASILKSTSSQINAVKGNTKTQSAQNLLTGSENDIRDFGVGILENQDLSVLSTALKATSKGTVELIALVQDLKGNFQEYTLSTTNGVDFTTLKVEEGTNSVEKQALTWKKLHDIIAQQPNNISMDFIDETSELWKDVSNAAENYKNELGEIVSITRSIRQDKDGNALESFKIMGSSGNSVTIGAELENVALKQRVDDGSYEKTTKHNQDIIAAYKERNKQTKEYYELLEKVKSDTATDTELERLNQIIEQWDKAINKKDEYNIQSGGDSKVEADARKIQDEFINSQSLNYSSMADKYVQGAKTILNKLSQYNFTDDFQVKINEASEIINKLQSKLPLDLINDQDSIKDVGVLKNLMSDINSGWKVDSNRISNETAFYKLQGKIADTLKENSAMSSKLKNDFRELQQEMERWGSSIPTNELKKLSSRFFELDTEMKRAGKTGRSFFDMVTNKAKHMSSAFIGQYLSLYDFVRYAQQAYQYVADIDKQMIELEKVSDMSASRLAESFDHAKESAKDLGSTVSDVISATADWSRLGMKYCPLI